MATQQTDRLSHCASCSSRPQSWLPDVKRQGMTGSRSGQVMAECMSGTGHAALPGDAHQPSYVLVGDFHLPLWSYCASRSTPPPIHGHVPGSQRVTYGLHTRFISQIGFTRRVDLPQEPILRFASQCARERVFGGRGPLSGINWIVGYVLFTYDLFSRSSSSRRELSLKSAKDHYY